MITRKLIIVTPAAAHSRSGNRHTALRWARILRGLGYPTEIVTEWRGEPCDGLIALHARKSHPSLRAFCARHPLKPALLALTGTDLYRDIGQYEEARASLDLAHRLVVLQEAAPEELSAQYRSKTRVIYQSTVASQQWQPTRRGFRVAILGHLREEKDPFRTAEALALLPPDTPIQIVQAGKALGDDMRATAQDWSAREPRYRWLDEVPHWRAMRLLAHSHVMVISSRMEGGAHVVSEAIAQGVPVIASDISGNRGMLGGNYPGYYPVENAAALAARLQQARQDPAYLADLAAAVRARRPLIEPARETAAWQTLLEECFPPRVSDRQR